MGSRGEILSRIRKGLGEIGARDGSALRNLLSREDLGRRWREAEAARSDRRHDLVEAFIAECRALSVQVHEAASGDAAGEALAAIVRDRGIERVMQWRTPLLDRLKISELLANAGATDVRAAAGGSGKDSADAAFSAAAGAQLGITGADYALADTGTLVIRHGRDQDRSTSLLPPVHVAFLEKGRILAGLDPLIARLQLDLQEGRDPDRCVTLISGPSKTADIGINLVLGIHGPREVHVILLAAP